MVKEIEVEEKKRGNKTGFKRSQRSREEQGEKKMGKTEQEAEGER